MTSTLPIGDFSRATHLSVKMLRHYHQLGLLEPVDVDLDSGYRRYAAEQIVAAQVIRRFRGRSLGLAVRILDARPMVSPVFSSAVRQGGEAATPPVRAECRNRRDGQGFV